MIIRSTETNNALTTINNDDDGFAAAALEAESTLIRGQLIKFVDGIWTLNKVTLAKGERFVPTKLAMFWVRWENQKPAEHVGPKPNGFLPARETLGDNDEADWPAGLDGKPKDCWQNTRYIYLTNTRTAETSTFTNSTAGIRACYKLLGEAVGNMRKAHPNAYPVVELDSAPMPTSFGTKLRPHFKIVDWKLGVERQEVPKIEQTDPLRKDMDDEIPF
jgi:hypothetical protein